MSISGYINVSHADFGAFRRKYRFCGIYDNINLITYYDTYYTEIWHGFDYINEFGDKVHKRIMIGEYVPDDSRLYYTKDFFKYVKDFTK